MKDLAYKSALLKSISAAALLAGCGGSQPPIGAPEQLSLRRIVPEAAFPYHKTFYFTGERQSFNVPVDVKWIDIVARGAAGGGKSRSRVRGSGGRGGRVHALIPVLAGETLYVYVGGRASSSSGGFNGGALGGETPSGEGAFGGGGASDVREGGRTLEDRVLVAGGGGGEGDQNRGYGDGGRGGGKIGGAGRSRYGSECGFDGGGGSGGMQEAGGSGGCGGTSRVSAKCDGHRGHNGRLGYGGAGGAGSAYCSSGYAAGSGGGGGGYYGGGGGGGGSIDYDQSGGGGGGGGGSSFVRRGTKDAHFWQGWKDATGDGLVVFSWQ